MALPIRSTPTYNLTIPSTNERVKYRPFLVKEEKALLIAQQSEDPVVMLDTIKDIIKSCVQENIDVEKLATFDVEYIFAQIRAVSVGETVELIFYCDTCTDENAKVQLQFDLTKLKVEKPEGHTNNIKLYDEIGIVMKYPNIETITKLQSLDNAGVDQIFDIIIDCIDYIYNTDQIFYAKEHTKEELQQFLDSMISEEFTKIQNFFETMPKIKQDVEYNCPVCGKHHHKVLEGIQSFF